MQCKCRNRQADRDLLVKVVFFVENRSYECNENVEI